MAHLSRNSLETFKQKTELCNVTSQGGDSSGQPTCCQLWALGTRGCSNQGHRAKRMMEMLQAGPWERGAEAQHFISGLEVSAAEPESLRRKKNKPF